MEWPVEPPARGRARRLLERAAPIAVALLVALLVQLGGLSEACGAEVSAALRRSGLSW